MKASPMTQVRNEHDLSVVELAQAAGMSHQTIWRIEKGHTQQVPGRLLELLEEAGYDPEEMIAGQRDFYNGKRREARQKITG